MSNLTKQLRWYIAVRVVAIGSVLIPYALIQIGPTSAPPLVEGSTPPPPAANAPAPSAPVLVMPPAPPPEPELLRPEDVFQLERGPGLDLRLALHDLIDRLPRASHLRRELRLREATLLEQLRERRARRGNIVGPERRLGILSHGSPRRSRFGSS